MRALQTMHAETVSSPTTSRSRLKAAWFQNDPLADGLDFGLATDRHTLEQAFRLQHDQYVAHGYMDAHPSGWRLSLHNALSATRVFVARCGGRVVGTMTLIADSPLGLPMDEIYTDELRRLRDARGNLAEVSALAMDPEYQPSGVPILLRLIRMLVIYAAQTVSDLCIAVNPHHAAFYRKAFHFQDIGGLKQYGKVNGAPAIALRLDLALARSLMSELRDGHRMISEVYEVSLPSCHRRGGDDSAGQGFEAGHSSGGARRAFLLPPRSMDAGFRGRPGIHSGRLRPLGRSDAPHPLAGPLEIVVDRGNSLRLAIT